MTVDRTRRFKLPGIHDLNKDQEDALALPLEGQHLIVGGPGTGKSVVALLRARKLSRNTKAYLTLVYNRMLDHSNCHLFGSSPALRSMTWDSWFRRICRYFLNYVPTLEPDFPGGYEPIDWKKIEHEVQSISNIETQSDKFIVIDEGQDMPPAFYRILIHLGFENFYVAADQNQQIHPDRCSSRMDIENLLVIEHNETLELKKNYRNSHPIALLSRHFYPGDPASPLPVLPAPEPTDVTPELWAYDKPTTTHTLATPHTLTSLAEQILRLSDRNPRKLIAIITPNNEIRKKFFTAINNANPRLDNGKPPVQTFHSGSRHYPDFSKGGIIIINVHACKGLEFDFVILADIDMHFTMNRDLGSLKSLFYVMISRARERVFLLRTGNVNPIVESLLPNDPIILIRIN